MLFCSGGLVVKNSSHELLTNGQTVTADLYSRMGKCTTGTASKEPALVNRKGVRLHDRSRISCRWPEYNTMTWLETLCHPPYSSDFAPSDYHLFHSLDNHLHVKSFPNEADVRQALMDFFVSHTPEFYRKEIEHLETSWQKGLDADGDYFED
ncbi:histone-lysine N-methyltransferase SETMAR [Trichonephila inaurata madagascariensis]|uniref:Histone-lysine N-methyltransferase SETMAR n=1 Tax=Trichonephila inaurata madagascariensis TaxID=2747483 RepID=A0A8X6WPM8_9ARAC|nr:histone-lysine N-methyltransferase SETMAR [Trichonephila inaurata madagascariensis]